MRNRRESAMITMTGKGEAGKNQLNIEINK